LAIIPDKTPLTRVSLRKFSNDWDITRMGDGVNGVT
jgi:hypothetical protein